MRPAARSIVALFLVAAAHFLLIAVQQSSSLSLWRGFIKGGGASVVKVSNEARLAFPRWDSKEGIVFANLLDYLEEREQQHVYIVDASGVYAPRSRRVNPKRRGIIETMIVRAWERLLHTINTNINNNTMGTYDYVESWPRLRQVVLEEGGFLFFLRDDDWKKCLNHVMGKQPVPLLTLAAPATDCNFCFPVPTYKTIGDAQPTKEDWDPIMANWTNTYSNKIHKIVWRGALTGTAGLVRNRHTTPRWQLVTKTNLQDENHNGTSTNAYFDAKLLWAPEEYRNSFEIDLSKYLNSSASIRPMAAFQQYYGVLDTDGYSWSSRFGTLLCYSSVVLKVAPMYVDYFHYKADNPLIPWKHFVPIKRNLSDLYENAAWVLDPANAPAVQQIVSAANEWCRSEYTYATVEKDYLDIWEAYVKLLDVGDPHWSKEAMRSVKEAIFANTTTFDMVQLE